MPATPVYSSTSWTGKRTRRISLSDHSNLDLTPTATASRPTKRFKPLDSKPKSNSKPFFPSLFDWIRGKTSPRPPLAPTARLPTSRPLRAQPAPRLHRHQHQHQQYSIMTPLPLPSSSSNPHSQSRLRPTNSTPFAFSLPRSLPTSTPAPAPTLTPTPTPYDKTLAAWKWDCSMAKAAGKPEPPKPQRPKMDKGKGKEEQHEEYRKKKPMGEAQHKTDVARYTHFRQQQLVEQNNCMSREKQELESSMASYRRSVDAYKLAQALDPSPSIPSIAINRRSSSSNKQRSSTGKGAGAWGVDHALETAKRTMAAPSLPPTFAYDQMQRSLAEIDRLAEEQLEGGKRRGRKWRKKLTREEQDLVDANFGDRSFRRVVGPSDVAQKDLVRLRGLTWLNDEVITIYGCLINERSKVAVLARKEGKEVESKEKGMEVRDVHCYNSFFYKNFTEGGYAKVKRWSRKFDTFSKQLIIIPINLGNSHWVCAAINLEKKRFEYYDSLGGPMDRVYATLRKYLEEEHLDKKKSPIDLSEWENYWDEDVPQQENSCDCGIFTCQFMETLSRNVEGFDFTQQQMPYLRNKMALEIHEERLIPEEEWVDLS